MRAIVFYLVQSSEGVVGRWADAVVGRGAGFYMQIRHNGLRACAFIFRTTSTAVTRQTTYLHRMSGKSRETVGAP